MTGTVSGTQVLEPLRTFDETARALRISKTKLHRLVAAGEITSVKVGDRRLFERSAIEAFIDRCREGP